MSDRDQLLNLLKTMCLIRAFEEKAKALHRQGVLPGALHLYIGEEAIAAGVCSALNTDDYIVSTHRGHGHCLAKGCDPRLMMAELLGREAGYSRGRGGSMHIFAPSLGCMGGNGIVGGGIPMATGLAYASVYKGDGKVTVCFFGDGATNQGTFHESLNMAALWNLPVVFVCENNHWAATTPVRDVVPTPNISDRAAAYGMPGVTVDGNDAEAVRRATVEAVDRARSGRGPTLIECKTLRYEGHCMVLQDCRLREQDEERYWKDRDPIPALEKKLLESGAATPDVLAQISKDAVDRVEEAEEFAKSAPFPDVEQFARENELVG